MTVKERPILFTGPMVTAILEGRKSQTRRVVNAELGPKTHSPFVGADGIWRWMTGVVSHVGDEARCAYGKSGDRLWVRETHGIFSAEGSTISVGYKQRLPEGKTIHDTDGGLNLYRLENPEQIRWAHEHVDSEKWRPSIFMPRWASRITLELTDIRVERLESISEEDAKAEGVTLTPCTHPDCQSGDSRCAADSYRGAYAALWNKINGKKHPWGSNPWVWVLAFKMSVRAA